MRKFRRREVLSLALPALALGLFGTWWSRKSPSVTEDDFVGGDGGPMVLLQSSVIPRWQGASNFDTSLMNGGTVETDYDVICRSMKPGTLMHRYDRDLLVLDDSEWGAYIFKPTPDTVAVVQQFQGDEKIASLLERTVQNLPTKSFRLHALDNSLRLLVGGDTGSGEFDGYKDVTIEPGVKRCDVFSLPEALIIIIRSV